MQQFCFTAYRHEICGGLFKHLIAAAVLCGGGLAHSEVHSLYITDSSVSGLELIGSMQAERYVVFAEQTISRLESSDGVPISAATYAVDCEAPGIANLAISFNKNFGKSKQPEWAVFHAADVPSTFNPATLKYQALEEFIRESHQTLSAADRALLPKVSNIAVMVKAACQMGADPTQAKQIAKNARENGGLADIRALACEIELRSGEKVTWEVRFSDTTGAVQVNGRWLGEGSSVSPKQINFYLPSLELRGTIDRTTGGWSSYLPGSRQYRGICDIAKDTPPKF